MLVSVRSGPTGTQPEERLRGTLKLKCPPANVITICYVQGRFQCGLALGFVIELGSNTREVIPPGSPDRRVLNLVDGLPVSLLGLVPL